MTKGWDNLCLLNLYISKTEEWRPTFFYYLADFAWLEEQEDLGVFQYFSTEFLLLFRAYLL